MHCISLSLKRGPLCPKLWLSNIITKWHTHTACLCAPARRHAPVTVPCAIWHEAWCLAINSSNKGTMLCLELCSPRTDGHTMCHYINTPSLLRDWPVETTMSTKEQNLQGPAHRQPERLPESTLELASNLLTPLMELDVHFPMMQFFFS